MELKTIKINNPEALNLVLGQSHFIKTVEDIYELMVNSVPGVKFAVAFCEASGKREIRFDGNDEELIKLTVENLKNIAAGHVFLIMMKNAFPINILPALKNVPEVCRIFCATANPLEVLIAQTEQGRGVMGVIDGQVPLGIENQEGKTWRHEFLRKIGYKK